MSKADIKYIYDSLREHSRCINLLSNKLHDLEEIVNQVDDTATDVDIRLCRLENKVEFILGRVNAHDKILNVILEILQTEIARRTETLSSVKNAIKGNI